VSLFQSHVFKHEFFLRCTELVEVFPVPSEKDSANLSTKIHKTVLVYDLVNFQFSIFMSNYPNVLIISSGLNVIWQL
jgi:hypothetical protein